MCYERLRELKCGHYESYQFDKCSAKLGRACEMYNQYILRKEKTRSCYKCKAEKLTVVGVASPSLAKGDKKHKVDKKAERTFERKELLVSDDGSEGGEWQHYLFQ